MLVLRLIDVANHHPNQGLKTREAEEFSNVCIAWKTGLGFETVPIEKGSFDWAETDFTLDSTVKENGLDLTEKVPVGTKIVGFVMCLSHVEAGKSFLLIANQTTKGINKFGLITPAASIPTGWIYGRVYIDADRLLDYVGDAGMAIGLAVVDWDI
ncbi:unnamed protein product [marine sediment metagenome]|uniref:Uncharacterized protein n=1 Tax=marine sediment metagenome TaxID=412755 RepID=X1KUM0_9ZZZZ